MNAIGRAARTAGGKAFAFNIFPAPANLAESREILRVLQSYGEVTTYKLFKYDKHNFADNRGLVIFKDESVAEAFNKACPLYFTLEQVTTDDEASPATNSTSETSQSDTTSPTSSPPSSPSPSSHPSPTLTSLPKLLFSPTAPTTPPQPPKPTPTLPFAPATPTPSTPKPFRLTSTPWLGSHRDYLAGTPFWGAFAPGRSAAQADLLRRLGQAAGAANYGLADTNVWGAVGGVPERVRRRRVEEGGKGSLEGVLAAREKG